MYVGGFNFDAPEAYRDVKFIGECDDVVFQLVDKLGWRVRMFVYVCVCVCVCMHVFMCVYVCIFCVYVCAGGTGCPS